jgi:hypothetical protein
VRSPDAILEFPCFRFAVYDHLYLMADWVAVLLRAASLEAGHQFNGLRSRIEKLLWM